MFRDIERVHSGTNLLRGPISPFWPCLYQVRAFVFDLLAGSSLDPYPYRDYGCRHSSRQQRGGVFGHWYFGSAAVRAIYPWAVAIIVQAASTPPFHGPDCEED